MQSGGPTLAPVPGPFDPGPPRWNPTTEIFPGGPHPGAVHQMHEEQRLRDEERALIAAAAVREARMRQHLLLLR